MLKSLQTILLNIASASRFFEFGSVMLVPLESVGAAHHLATVLHKLWNNNFTSTIVGASINHWKS
jgi:hypothetical protein